MVVAVVAVMLQGIVEKELLKEAAMSEKNNIIFCPGQGAQHVGMGKGWYGADVVAREVFEEANDVLGFDLAKVCFDGPVDEVNRTDVAQAAIYVVSVASYRALVDRGVVGNVVATAGLSLGEYTALHLAGAFDFADGLMLVRKRGQYMQEAAETVESGMVALIGVDEEQAETICERARGDEVLVGANYNCRGQVVISGGAEACEQALKVAEGDGVVAVALSVAGAFHSPLMQSAADRMVVALDEVKWSSPTVPVLSNVTGSAHDNGDVESIKKLLVEQITHPVRWEADVRWLLDNVAGCYIELAPGRVLSGLMRRIDRKTKVENYAEPGE